MAELDRAAISARLGESREQAGLTQPEMAELLRRDDAPLHWRTVQNYESPKNQRVPWDLLDQWAQIAGTTKEWLLHGAAIAEPQSDDALLLRLEPLLQELNERLARIEEHLREPARPRRARPPASQR